MSRCAVTKGNPLDELTEPPVTLLSTSPDRGDTIMVRDPFYA